MSRPDSSDFVSLVKSFQKLSPGQKAEIRRAHGPDDLGVIPAFYRLLPKGEKPDRRWRRTIYFLPHADHKAGAGNIGARLAKRKISEMRIFQMARSQADMGLVHLKRLCHHAEATVDWEQFGPTVFYWGERSQRSIVEDYFMNGGGK